MKKTLTPLNDVYMRDAFYMPRAHRDMLTQQQKVLRAHASSHQVQIARVAKHSMK